MGWDGWMRFVKAMDIEEGGVRKKAHCEFVELVLSAKGGVLGGFPEP